MALADTIQNDIAGVFLNPNDFAVVVQYTPQGGTQKAIYAVIDPELQDVEFPTAANRKWHQRFVHVSAADVPNPMKLAIDGGSGDTLTFSDSTVWHVVDCPVNGIEAGTGMHTLQVRDQNIPIR